MRAGAGCVAALTPAADSDPAPAGPAAVTGASAVASVAATDVDGRPMVSAAGLETLTMPRGRTESDAAEDDEADDDEEDDEAEDSAGPRPADPPADGAGPGRSCRAGEATPPAPAASSRAGRCPRRVADPADPAAESAGDADEPGEPVVSAAATEGSHIAAAPTPRAPTPSATANDPTRPTYRAGPTPSAGPVPRRVPESIGRTRNPGAERRRETRLCVTMKEFLS